MSAHHFCGSDGTLYDTRAPDWSERPPLRSIYRRVFTHIRTGVELRATLRAMPHLLHDGDDVALLLDDGEVFCEQCARDCIGSMLYSLRHGLYDGWRPIGLSVCYGGESEVGDICAHCGRQLSEPRSSEGGTS